MPLGRFLRGAISAMVLLPSLALAANSDDVARKKLTERLLQLSRRYDMQETSFPESAGGGKSFNANDGNSFMSTTTYHSNVWSTCLRWVGGRYCDKWLDPYVSEHGGGADQSPLEATIFKEWSKYANGGRSDAGQGTGKNQYTIWQVDTKEGGSVIDVDGKLNTEVLSRWELLDDVKKKVQADGERTAVNNIALTYDDNAPKGETLPNMESLRMMAQRWTKMYRNRMVSNIGELRAMSRGVEFALGEDMPDCQSYVRAVRSGRDVDQTRIEERRERQALLEPETKGALLDERLQACMRLRSASVKMVNAQLQGGNVVAGNIDSETYDKVAARLSIDSIDQAGVDINSLERPSWFNLSEDQKSNELVEFESGGRNKRKVRRTNAQQLSSYNRSLESAAVGMTEVAARSGGVVADSGDRIRSYKLKPGTVNAVDLNGMTDEMYGELRNTDLPVKSRTAKNNPAQNLEDRPHQLTITRSP